MGTLTVNTFMEAARERLLLNLVSGAAGVDRVIHEQAINRPGLALAGVYRHFPFRRVQVLGLAETDYLLAMTEEQRHGALLRLFEQKIPCLVFCRNRKVWPEVSRLADQFKIPVFRTPVITGTFVNMATLVIETLSAPSQTYQGTMVDIMGIGVLVEGKPGIGKSEAALALVTRGHSLVADDLTMLRRMDEHTIMAASSETTRYHMEIRGLGIIHVPSLFGVASVRDQKQLDLIISLREFKEFENGDEQVSTRVRDILGVSIPHLIVPVAAGRELANVIEVAALNEKLKRLGHDAAKELNQKLMTKMTRRAKDGE